MNNNIENIQLSMKEILAIIIQRLFSIFPIEKDKVFSLNYYGKGYGDNGKYVCDAILQKSSDVRIIWPIKGECILGDAPRNVIAVRYYSLPFFYHLVTSKIWLSNSRMPSYFRKRKKQYYIQLWHGAIALKKVEADACESLLPSYIRGAKNDSKMADLFISNSTYWSNIIRNSFWYTGEILECGVPRLDILYHRDKNKEIIKKKIGVSSEKIALYAPTFRNSMELDCYSMDYLLLKQSLENRTGMSWRIFVRLHPSLVGKGVRIPLVEGISDYSLYPDMYELMQVTDILITDYSSIMFEAAIVGIPVILFATDIVSYNKDREFYFDIYKLPFPLAQTNDELSEIIEKWDADSYFDKVRKFITSLDIVEGGNASEQIAEVIMRHLV